LRRAPALVSHAPSHDPGGARRARWCQPGHDCSARGLRHLPAAQHGAQAGEGPRGHAVPADDGGAMMVAGDSTYAERRFLALRSRLDDIDRRLDSIERRLGRLHALISGFWMSMVILVVIVLPRLLRVG